MKYQFLVNVLCFAPIEHHQLYTYHHATKVIKATKAHHQTHGFNYNGVFKLEMNRGFSMVLYFFDHFWTHVYGLIHFPPNFVHIKDSALQNKNVCND
jgi:hypothetical protein